MAYKNIEINGSSGPYQQAAKQSHFYKGFSSSAPNNIGSRLYDFELVKQDILNHFNTRKGERVMNPDFGSIIWDLLMEPLTTQVRTLLTQDITKICNFDPRVSPIQIDLTEYPSGYMVEITLLLNGTDQSSKLKMTFNQELGLTVQ